MLEKEFFSLQETTNPRKFLLHAGPEVCVGPSNWRFMFGGVGLAAAVVAMERVSSRQLICATAHFLAPVPLGASVQFDVDTLAEGRRITQAQARATIENQPVLCVNAALGGRPSDIQVQWAVMPSVSAPHECPLFEHWRGSKEGVHARFEHRLANQGIESGIESAEKGESRLLLWSRFREKLSGDAALMAILADHAHMAIGHALGQMAGGPSLDNTLRIHSRACTEWVLSEYLALSVHEGIAHVAVRLFSNEGQLLASGSQSFVLRIRQGASDR